MSSVGATLFRLIARRRPASPRIAELREAAPAKGEDAARYHVGIAMRAAAELDALMPRVDMERGTPTHLWEEVAALMDVFRTAVDRAGITDLPRELLPYTTPLWALCSENQPRDEDDDLHVAARFEKPPADVDLRRRRKVVRHTLRGVTP